MTEQPKEYKFGYFSRHKYQDLVFYIINEDGQTNTGLFEMPDTPENRALMEALIPRPVSTPPEGVAPETKPYPVECPCCGETFLMGFKKEQDAAAAIEQERERIRKAVEERMDTMYEDFYGYKGILAIIDNGGK